MIPVELCRRPMVWPTSWMTVQHTTLACVRVRAGSRRCAIHTWQPPISPRPTTGAASGACCTCRQAGGAPPPSAHQASATDSGVTSQVRERPGGHVDLTDARLTLDADRVDPGGHGLAPDPDGGGHDAAGARGSDARERDPHLASGTDREDAPLPSDERDDEAPVAEPQRQGHLDHAATRAGRRLATRAGGAGLAGRALGARGTPR